MENFNLRFGGFAIVMRPEELFDHYGSFLQFKMSSSLEESLDMWILGAPILKKFTMVFDKDQQEIGFFGADVKYIGDIKEKPFSFFSVAVICILVVLVALVCYVLYRFFKEKNAVAGGNDAYYNSALLHSGNNDNRYSNNNKKNSRNGAAINSGYDF